MGQIGLNWVNNCKIILKKLKVAPNGSKWLQMDLKGFQGIKRQLGGGPNWVKLGEIGQNS